MKIITIIGVIVLGGLIFGAVSLCCRRWQRRIWNDGYCRCGGMWHCFDMDSGGAFGAKCDRCENTFWFDWYVGREIDPYKILGGGLKS